MRIDFQHPILHTSLHTTPHATLQDGDPNSLTVSGRVARPEAGGDVVAQREHRQLQRLERRPQLVGVGGREDRRRRAAEVLRRALLRRLLEVERRRLRLGGAHALAQGRQLVRLDVDRRGAGAIDLDGTHHLLDRVERRLRVEGAKDLLRRVVEPAAVGE